METSLRVGFHGHSLRSARQLNLLLPPYSTACHAGPVHGSRARGVCGAHPLPAGCPRPSRVTGMPRFECALRPPTGSHSTNGLGPPPVYFSPTLQQGCAAQLGGGCKEISELRQEIAKKFLKTAWRSSEIANF